MDPAVILACFNVVKDMMSRSRPRHIYNSLLSEDSVLTQATTYAAIILAKKIQINHQRQHGY